MIQKRPERRYPRMKDVSEALKGWLTSHGFRADPSSGAAGSKPINGTATGGAGTKGGSSKLQRPGTGSGVRTLVALARSLAEAERP